MDTTAKNSSKLDIRDLINIGIFTAVYFIIFMICAATSYIPVMVFAFTVAAAILAGIPLILFLTRTKKFGMVTIMCILLGLIVLVMGYGPFGFGVSVACGLIADFILKAGGWKSWKCMLASYVVVSLWPVGTLVPIIIMGSAYFEGFRESMGDAYVTETTAIFESVAGYLIPVIIILTAIAAVIGAYLGKAVLKKHFVRAGIA